MSQWSLEFDDRADKDLRKLGNITRRQIIRKLDWILENFDSILFPAPLHSKWRDFYKLRVGGYRIVYQINWYKFIIIIRYIDNRNRIYKRR